MNDYHVLFFFFKQKTAYEMRISDWSSDVCSSDLDINDSQSKSALDSLDLDLQMFAKLTVERAERLVHQHEVGFEHQRARQRDPLPLTARQGVGTAFAEPVEFHQRERVRHFRRSLATSAERRVGKECVSTCGSRWSPE